LSFSRILENIWNIISDANNYIAQKEPWKLAKTDIEELKKVMFNIWNALRLTAISVCPFMPETAEKIWKQLGLKSLEKDIKQSWLVKRDEEDYPEIFEWDWKPLYEIKVLKAEHLFPRIENKK
ncbi:MAG: hypothetical protein LLF28_08775, partial [Nitrospiraceae bacterium]|nr:hypothetical protein [Nitrospiraceae bacterium]